ncbi:MAG TPA: SDR family oxidoreductase [Burkholderiaceae bacterium]|nr:SDR family oxidoreductase [Burkholderiaceae bacterium]
MPVSLKKINEQVIVITGATSGVGLVTARQAAQRGARLVLAARNEPALKQLAAELTGRGIEVVHVVADVGDDAQVRAIAQAAVLRFGGFDTWINNAGVSIYGRTEDIPLADQRRLFDTNFWGVVNGSLVAVEHLKQRGGALINIGSELSDVAAPLQGIYSASKHAVKGFTDALRLELEHAGAPVSVTLVKPAALDTPYLPHARNYLEVEPRLAPPVYAPEVAASAILYAAQRPRRDVYVGGAAKFASASSRFAPRTTDWLLRKTMFWMQRTDRPARNEGGDGLYEGAGNLRERNGSKMRVHEWSAYTQAAIHPRVTAAIMLGLLFAAGYWITSRPPQRPVRRLSPI